MAVARAQQRGGVTGLHIWLITFVALWLASLVLLILVYLERDDLQKTVAETRQENQRLISPDERRGELQVWYERAGDRNSAMGALNEDRKGILQAFTGSEADDAQTATTKLEQILGQIAGDPAVREGAAFESMSALAALEQLYELYKNEYESLVSANKSVTDLTTRVEGLAVVNTQQRAEFEDHVDEMKGKVASLEQEHSDYREARDREIGDFDKRLTEVRTQATAELKAEQTSKEQMDRDFRALLERYRGLEADVKPFLVGPEPLSAARKADGMVIRATPGEDIVYINLGQSHRLVLGMQFALYPSETGVTSNGRSKARIEVVRIAQYSSECRVVAHNTLEPIVAGDVIANPVYDKDRALSFAVTGKFDLDRDGTDDPDGREKVRVLIERWGGQVTDELSPRTDFVIAGAPPLVPLNPRTDQEKARAQSASEELAAYERMIGEAARLSIPMLSQQTFLGFLGYSSTARESPF